MKALAAAALVLASHAVAQAQLVTLSFHKDRCEKFLRSEPLDQEMYLEWASSHIMRTFGIRFSSVALSKPIRTYCAANQTTVFSDAADAVEPKLAASTKPQ